MVTLEEIAQYTFLAFVAIAIIAGLVIGYMAYEKQDEMGAGYDTYPYGLLHEDLKDPIAYVTLVMLILGIVVGLVSVTAKEVGPFLLAAIALIVVKTTSMLVVGAGGAAVGDVWGSLSVIHDLLAYWAWAIINFLVAFVAPAAVIIAARQVWVLARKK